MLSDQIDAPKGVLNHKQVQEALTAKKKALEPEMSFQELKDKIINALTIMQNTYGIAPASSKLRVFDLSESKQEVQRLLNGIAKTLNYTHHVPQLKSALEAAIRKIGSITVVQKELEITNKGTTESSEPPNEISVSSILEMAKLQVALSKLKETLNTQLGKVTEATHTPSPGSPAA